MSTPVGGVGQAPTFGGMSGYKRNVVGNPTSVPRSQTPFRGVKNTPGSTVSAPSIRASFNRQDRGTNVTIPQARLVAWDDLRNVGRVSPGDAVFTPRMACGGPHYAQHAAPTPRRSAPMASYADLHAAVQADPRSLPKIAALLKLIRTQKLRQSQVVATHGKTALQDPRRAARVLGDDVWAVYEQTLVAALDVDDAPLRDACQSALLKRFGGANPPSQRLERLEGLVAEAAGDWEAALQRYKGVLAQNPANSTALKREVCVVEAKGAGREAVIAALTKLTATCQSDRGAWQALAEAHAGLPLLGRHFLLRGTDAL